MEILGSEGNEQEDFESNGGWSLLETERTGRTWRAGSAGRPKQEQDRPWIVEGVRDNRGHTLSFQELKNQGFSIHSSACPGSVSPGWPRVFLLTDLGLVHVTYSWLSRFYPGTSPGNGRWFQWPLCFSSANFSPMTTSKISLSGMLSMEPQKAMKVFKCRDLGEKNIYIWCLKYNLRKANPVTQLACNNFRGWFISWLGKKDEILWSTEYLKRIAPEDT